MTYKKHRQDLKNRDREPDRRKLWWVDLAWLTSVHQATLSFLPLNKTGGYKIQQKSLWVKIRTKRSLTNYCHRQNRLNLGQLIYCQSKSEYNNEKYEQI